MATSQETCFAPVPFFATITPFIFPSRVYFRRPQYFAAHGGFLMIFPISSFAAVTTRFSNLNHTPREVFKKKKSYRRKSNFCSFLWHCTLYSQMMENVQFLKSRIEGQSKCHAITCAPSHIPWHVQVHSDHFWTEYAVMNSFVWSAAR